MRLSELTLCGFRSVTNSLNVRLRPNLTCLIGANEHGKSNLLEGINLLRSGNFSSFDKSTTSRSPEEPWISYSLQLSSAERAGLLKDISGALANPAADSDSARQYRKFLEKEAEYFSNEGAKIVVVLEPKSRKLTVPGVVNYTDITLEPDTKSSHVVVKWAIAALPQVRLFESPNDLADSITAEELEARTNVPFEGLLKLARAWDDRALLFEDSIKGRQRLDQAGRAITRKIKQIWSQGSQHTYRLDQTGGRLHLSIKDPITFDAPSKRSLGYRSFFSFYLALYAETEAIDPDGFILLFDEPGIHLHPQGQKDLLAEIRRLADRNQIVYTTHSPFMVDRNQPENTMLVEKGSKGKLRGTRINYKPWGSNWDPLSGALGITPADAFFLPDRPLIVEGTSDKLYIAMYMGLCRQVTKADLNYLSILDADRREDIEALVRILLGADRRVLVLVDGDQGGEEWKKRLRKMAGSRRELIDVLVLSELLGSKKPVSIEDVLPHDTWFEALRMYVETILGDNRRVDVEQIQALSADRTLGRAAAEYLTTEKFIARTRDFSKTNVAHLYCQRPVDKPAADEPMSILCAEITRKLNLAER